ncbi:glycosyltransferase family 1 protein [soil metagenome]
MQDLICVSHLRWGFVWQRPQHLLSRLAEHYRVLFVEEPMTNTEIAKPQLDIHVGHTLNGAEVTLACMQQPADHHFWIGHRDPNTQKIYEHLLLDYLAAEEYHDPILWLYTPMASRFAQVMPHKLLIYDVMDELSAFKGAPTALKEQDQQLLHQSDIVFTGGASLYRSRSPHNVNTHLFPSGVEAAHFARAASEEFARPADLANMASPILGYFGVIDERMDLPLLRHLAEAHPEWNLVLIGPILKIEPADLPKAANIHFLGMKDYKELPSYLACFDVALVPFAMNEATRYLSPTKTLEYLAAHKPTVSTPLPDVVELYGDFVRIGHTPEEFVAQVEQALAEDTDVRRLRQIKEKTILAQYSWDIIARRMHQIIEVNLTPSSRLKPNSVAEPTKAKTAPVR